MSNEWVPNWRVTMRSNLPSFFPLLQDSADGGVAATGAAVSTVIGTRY